MTLDELERKAKAAEWKDDSEPKTYEHFIAVERFQEAITAPLVLALIERVRELERDRHTVAHELGCADDAGAYAANNAVARIQSLEAALDRAYNGDASEKDVNA